MLMNQFLVVCIDDFASFLRAHKQSWPTSDGSRKPLAKKKRLKKVHFSGKNPKKVY
jgi:hypothetical protein